MGNTTDIITTTFNHNNSSYRVTQLRGGSLEIYRADSYPEMFVGYASEVNIDLANAAWDAFQDTPGQRWLFDVGSEFIHRLSDGRWAH